MSVLSLKAELKPHETLSSYCSRTAAINGIDSASIFASHFGFDFRRLSMGWQADVSVFARLVGKAEEHLKTSVVNQRRELVETAGSSFSREFMDTDRCRFCPACVLDDIGPYNRLHKAWRRVEWMVGFTHTCPDHLIPLTHVGGDLEKIADFSAQLRSVANKLEHLAKQPKRNIPMRLQSYVAARLRGQEPQGIWLDNFPLQPAAHFAQLLGAIVRDGIEPHIEDYSEYDWIAVADIGFEIASGGKHSVTIALEQFFTAPATGSKVTLGMLLGRLQAELLTRWEQPGYLELVKVLEDIARKRYPLLSGVM